MHNRFLQFIKKHAPINDEGKVLLAISGGVDSMVLWHLVHQSGIQYAIAHCNFQLRGEASEDDEAFIREQASRLEVTCYVEKFDTKSYATINKVSTQMAARDLRYHWFDNLCSSYGFTYVFLAHHANDDVETFLLNMVRGTSIKGLSGMKPVRDLLVRPLLDMTKDEVLSFAKANGIHWREDSSNAEIYYKRNFLRKEVIPSFTSLNPDFLQTMKRNMAKNLEVSKLTSDAIAKLSSSLLKKSGKDIVLDKSELKLSGIGPFVLSEMLKDYGFNYYQCEEIVSGLDGLSGKVYESSTHELAIDRDELLVRIIADTSASEVLIGKEDGLFTDAFEYKAKVLTEYNPRIDREPRHAMFDLDKLVFPLVLRKWREGDKFQPLGMTGQKLVSDLLIDLKYSVFEKDTVHVLCSENKIVWVVGLRISDRFKVESNTSFVLHYQLVEPS